VGVFCCGKIDFKGSSKRKQPSGLVANGSGWLRTVLVSCERFRLVLSNGSGWFFQMVQVGSFKWFWLVLSNGSFKWFFDVL
jgi:hypothetical protein